MKGVDLIRIGAEYLKEMSSIGLGRDDYRYLELYDEYARMRKEGEKVDYILSYLSQKYGISDSSIKRIAKRFSKEI